jgi:hypothetical protein
MKKLENDLKELNKLFISNDQELRKKIRDIRITNTAGVIATEYSLAKRLGITIDVVLALIPPEAKPAVEAEIEKRVSQIPPTHEIAMRYAAKKYAEEGDDY